MVKVFQNKGVHICICVHYKIHNLKKFSKSESTILSTMLKTLFNNICKSDINYRNLTTIIQRADPKNIKKMNNIDYFKERRTIRSYSNQNMSEELLNEMIEAASHAPTTGNMQLYSVIVTKNEEMKSKLAPAHFNQPSVMSADAVLTFCADFNRFVKWCEQRNATPGYDNFQAWMWAVEDTMIFAQQFVTIAEMNGLGTCYLGTTTYNAPQISQILELPEMVVPVTTVTVGFPTSQPEKSDRLPLKAIMHKESYHQYAPNDIDEFYAEKEARGDSKKFIAENNKETLAQVFTDVRYPKADNEHFSKVYFDYIKKQGFKI